MRDGYDTIGEQYLHDRPDDGHDVALLDDLVGRLAAADLVLDAGCGAGVPVASHLTDASLAVVGLDLSRRQLTRARELRAVRHVTQADLAALPFRDETFAAVVSYYAVIHVPRTDHHRVHTEMHRVVRAGGFALLCLGASDLPEDHDPESWLGAPMYWSHFDATTNLSMLEAAGFRIVWHRLIADPMAHGHHLFVLATRS